MNRKTEDNLIIYAYEMKSNVTRGQPKYCFHEEGLSHGR